MFSLVLMQVHGQHSVGWVDALVRKLQKPLWPWPMTVVSMCSTLVKHTVVIGLKSNLVGFSYDAAGTAPATLSPLKSTGVPSKLRY